MDFTQRILTFGLIFGVVNGQVQTNAIVTSAKSKENVGIAAVQSPIELGFELGKRRKDPGGLPITNFLESNFVKDTSIRLPSVGITTTEEMISASNLKVLPSDNTGTHRPTTVSATTLTDLIWPDRANTGTTDASSGSNAWVLPSTTTDKSRGWAPSTQIPGSRNLDIWDTQSARAADGMGLMNALDPFSALNSILPLGFYGMDGSDFMSLNGLMGMMGRTGGMNDIIPMWALLTET